MANGYGFDMASPFAICHIYGFAICHDHQYQKVDPYQEVDRQH
jgi:hypothetical protein